MSQSQIEVQGGTTVDRDEGTVLLNPLSTKSSAEQLGAKTSHIDTVMICITDHNTQSTNMYCAAVPGWALIIELATSTKVEKKEQLVLMVRTPHTKWLHLIRGTYNQEEAHIKSYVMDRQEMWRETEQGNQMNNWTVTV